MSINRIGAYFKGKTLDNGAKYLDVYDNFNIEIDTENMGEKVGEKMSEKVGINAIGKIDENGYYFHVLAIYKNGKIYRAERYHIKYITLVRDIIFEYYKENDMVAWLK